jgi:hypothetical protein
MPQALATKPQAKPPKKPRQANRRRTSTHLVNTNQIFATVADAGIVKLANGIVHFFTRVVLDNTFPEQEVSIGNEEGSSNASGDDEKNEGSERAILLSTPAGEHVSEHDAPTLTSVVLEGYQKPTNYVRDEQRAWENLEVLPTRALIQVGALQTCEHRI